MILFRYTMLYKRRRERNREEKEKSQKFTELGRVERG